MVGDPVPLTAYQKQVVGLGPELALYYPLDEVYGAGDLSARGHDGKGEGGISIGGRSPGATIRDGRNGTTFDGSNDQVLTNWQTRTNLMTAPTGEGISLWTKPGSQSLSTTGKGRISGKPAIQVFTFLGTPEAWSPNVPVTAGTQLTASAYAQTIGAFGGISINIDWKKAGGTYISSSAKVGEDINGRAAVTATAPAEAAEATIVISGTTIVVFDAVLVEVGSAVGEFFPHTSQLETEEAGWTGTAGKSTSQIGPLANGTIRTFCGWVNPAETFATRGLWGRSGVDGFYLNLFGQINWRANGVDENWGVALPTGRWNFLTHVFDTRSDLSRLVLNGALVGEKANANPYSTQAAAQFVVGQALGAFWNGGIAHFALMYGDQSDLTRSLWRAGSGL